MVELRIEKRTQFRTELIILDHLHCKDSESRMIMNELSFDLMKPHTRDESKDVSTTSTGTPNQASMFDLSLVVCRLPV